MWLFYALLASSLFALQTLLRRKLLRDNNRLHHITVSLTYLSFSCLATLYALVFFRNEIYPSDLNSVAFNIVLGGLLYGLATSIDTFAASHVDAVVSSIIIKLSTVTVIIGGAVILHEYLTPQQLVGAVAIMAASLMLVGRTSGKKIHVDKFALLLIANSIIFGLAAVNEKYTLGKINLATFMIFGWGMQTLFIGIYAIIRQLKLKPTIPKGYISKSLLLGIVQFAGATAYLYALIESDNQPLVVSVLGIGTLFTAVGGMVFLHETNDLKKKFLATALGIIGIVIIAFG